MGRARIVPGREIMMGWVVLIFLALAIFGLIRRIAKPSRGAQEMLAAALIAGMAGYALQGRPDLPASPAKISTAKGQEATELINMRADMDDAYGPAKKWLITADAFSRSGNYQVSSAFIRSGLKEYPDNADLWAALGLQIMLAGEGRLSPPAMLAFDRARKLSPQHPAADYFEGLAALFEGRVEITAHKWKSLLDNTPARAKWRPRLESQLNGLMRLNAAVANQIDHIPPNN